MFFETNDVYGFGVLLLELVTGQEASHIDSFGSNESILRWVCKNSIHFTKFTVIILLLVLET